MRGLRSRALVASLAVAAVTLGLSVPASQAAGVPQFTVSLSGANEVPSAGDPGVTGDAQISIPSPTTICYSAEFFGLSSNAAGLHLHVGAAGINGPMLVMLSVPAVKSGVTSGCVTALAGDVANIRSDPSGFYLNLHSGAFPGGAARGQLQAATADPSSTSLTFGSGAAPIPQGTLSAPQVVTVTNNGLAPLAISGFDFGGANPDDFIVGGDTCHAPMDPGASCTVEVRFAPQAQGTRSATLTVSSNAPASTPIALQGTAGPLPQGPAGAPGPQGEPGKPGSQGKPGQIRLVTCTAVRVKVHGHKVKRHRCTTKLITGTVTFRINSHARASLVRHGVLYATGTAGRNGLVLHARRPVRAGRYTLRLRYRVPHREITASTQVVIA